MISKEELGEQIKTGKRNIEIAKIFGVDSTVISHYKKKYGFYIQPRNTKKIDVELVRQKVAKGYTCEEIGLFLGATKSKINYICKKNGISLDKKFIVTEEIKNKIYELAKNGKILSEISQEIKCPRHIAINILKEFNFSTRENGKQYKKKNSVEKYGVDHPMKLDKFKNKMKETNLKKYGHQCSLHGEGIKKKTEQTNLNKFGYTNPIYSKDIQEKIKQTNLKKYGNEYSVASEKVRKTIEKTNIVKYGHKCHLSNRNIRSKIAKTNLKKYGCESSLSNSGIQRKARNTMQKRYGANNMPETEYFKNKMIEKFGFPFCTQSKVIKEKTKQTNIKKYGAESYAQSLENRERLAKKNNWKNVWLVNTKEDFNKIVGECKHISQVAEKTGLNHATIFNYCNKFDRKDLIRGTESGIELKIKNFLISIGEKPIKKRFSFGEIDCYLQDKKIGFEINGNYWHSDYLKKYTYHQEKSLKAEKEGIRIFHIWEYEISEDKIFRYINYTLKKDHKKIMARKCEIKEINNQEASSFLNQYHLQGENKKSSVAIGLFYFDELVSVMTFGRGFFSKKTDWELTRFGSKCNVAGAASRLFSFFIKKYNPESIISFSDIAKFNGDIYVILGFKLNHISRPSYVWWSSKTGIVSRYKTRIKNEDKTMKEQGFFKLYDCGKKVWVWTSQANLGLCSPQK